MIFAWNTPPSTAILRQASQQAQHLIVGLSDYALPDWQDDADFQAALSCIQFYSANVLEHLLLPATLWLLPQHAMRRLSDYFGSQPIIWQTEAVEQETVFTEKIYFKQPESFSLPKKVIIIGAGIAGAATAYELAKRGIAVTVLEAANAPASAASGNRQGLLYAKISPHNTPQTELLLNGYGYTRHLLNHLLPQSSAWHNSGVLHLNHNAAETRRNAALAAQTVHQHLYRGVSAAEASELAGVSLDTGGLYWQHGVWLNPSALITALLSHERIELQLNCTMLAAEFDGEHWQVHTSSGDYVGSHVVFCVGANSATVPIIRSFPFQMIRGQTSLVGASAVSRKLKVALSGQSYCAPAWDDVHCFGATFLPNDAADDWRDADEWHNRMALSALNDEIYQSFDFSGSLKGHAAVRCDAHDHLPVVGALGNPTAMREVYAKWALDKHYRIDTPCPFYPNAFVNTAHGSRGLTTAPICAAHLVATMLDQPRLLSPRIAQAIHPNRLIVRGIVHKK